MKICTCCKAELDLSFFRDRFDKRKGCSYKNSTCKSCDVESAKQYYEKNKNNADFKERNANRATKYRNNNKVVISERQKQVRRTPEYRSLLKQEYKNKRDIILPRVKRNGKKYMAKIRAEVTRQYAIVQLLHPRNGLSKNELTKQLIELKIKKIKSWRLQKQ